MNIIGLSKDSIFVIKSGRTIKIFKIMKKTQVIHSVGLGANDILVLCTNDDILFVTTKEYNQIGEIPGGPFLNSVVFGHNIAAVSASDVPPYTPFYLLLYNMANKKCINTIEFPSRILVIKATESLLIVSLESRIIIYNTSNFKIMSTIIRQSVSGLICVSNNYFAWIDDQRPGIIILSSLSNFEVVNTIFAHNGPIQSMAISNNGKELVTSSHKGTVIRIFDITSGKKLKEFRRGYTQNIVRCIAADDDTVVICTARTIHTFSSRGHIYGNIYSNPMFAKINGSFVTVITDDGRVSVFKIDESEWKILEMNQFSLFTKQR